LLARLSSSERGRIAPAPAVSFPWVWSQRWLDLLFLHWRVPPASVQACLPPGLEVDTYGGSAWLSLVLFRLRLRPRWLPFVPGISFLTEVNLRTYVRAGEKAGIYFLSIHADNRCSVWLARRFTPLPYRWAAMAYGQTSEGFSFARFGRLKFEFRATGPTDVPANGTLDGWLLERYLAFGWSERKGLQIGEVAHPRWAVRGVELSRVRSEERSWWDFAPPGTPDVMHFAGRMEALFGPFRRVVGPRPT
jgi:uncharacterized protein YqjF (DUF2071 family)